MNMRDWLKDIIANPVKKAIPVLSFPSVQLLGVTVNQLIRDPSLQARGMKAVADRVDSGASLSMMDLSVEAEAFGSEIRFSDDEVPTVIGSIASNLDEANALAVPPVGAGRTGLYIDAIGQAAKLITDRPVFSGVIGPFSLAGRLIGVSEAMVYCIDEPEMVHAVMRKTTQFMIEYIKAYKSTGAGGVVIAEPLTGLMSPALAEEFSEPYVRGISRAVRDEDFLVIYHNCGGSAVRMTDSILRTECDAFHFGNAVDMAEVMRRMPAGVPAMGNVDPARQFRNGTPESIREQTLNVLNACGRYSNFIISSGCDVPPMSSWENIDAFFGAVAEYYHQSLTCV